MPTTGSWGTESLAVEESQTEAQIAETDATRTIIPESSAQAVERKTVEAKESEVRANLSICLASSHCANLQSVVCQTKEVVEQLAGNSLTVQESQSSEVTTNDSHQTGYAIEESQDSQTTRESQTPEGAEESQTAEGSRMEAQVGESYATHTTIIPEPFTQAVKHKTVEAVCERQVSALVDEDERHIQGIMQIHLMCHSTYYITCRCLCES